MAQRAVSKAMAIVKTSKAVLDRRASPRVRTVYRLVKICHDGDEGFARCRNISDEGMKLELYMSVGLGSRVEIIVSPGIVLAGRVVWADGNECGVAFDEPVDCIELLSTITIEAHAAGARAPRLETNLPITVEVEGSLHPVVITDVSLRGMKIQSDESFRPGLNVTVLMGGGKERRGLVRWVKGALAGIMLAEPLPVEELGSAQKFLRC